MAYALAAAPAHAADCPTGQYRAAAGPDTASMLEIGKDGHFRYVLSEGAVDEGAEGRWICKDGVLHLTTEPTPKPAAFTLDKVTDGEEADFALIVTWPDGRGIPAVDFRIGFAEGEPVTGYTQDDGWARDLEGRKPMTLQVAEPFYGTVSPVFPVPDRKHIRLHVVLTPNDLGVAPFQDTLVTRSEDGVVLHWRGREIPYRAEP